ncbi:formate transporter FocA [Pasteurellaceae bacterium TAE3-ERU1]|nr:formate transporter FocA [Spirabiliibacterium mucosae]MBE2898455.1 formate transporter FocA [Spirabiliibacterium mucosae]MBV7387256.1 formate transporter FocA [Pasteurellaceae bacterium TAE3-ERU1]
MSANEQPNSVMLTPTQMTAVAVSAGAYKARKNQLLSFVSAIVSGAFIAIAFVFYATTQTGSADVAWGLAKFVGGIVFSLGIIMVIVCGTELFTSSTMTVLAKVEGKISFVQMFRNWAVVYAGNLVGSLFIVALVWFGGQTMADHGQWGLTILNTAQHKIHHTWLEAFCLGIFCNIMVCIAIWMAYSGKTLTDKMLIAILPISMFVASGFEHCVANMFMIPMGIVTAHNSSAEFWQAIGLNAAQYADLNLGHFVLNNLIPVTLGNIVGGSFCIALVQWFLNREHH